MVDILNDHFIKTVNKKHLEIYKNESIADIVIIYNNELFLPETLKEIKKRYKGKVISARDLDVF